MRKVPQSTVIFFYANLLPSHFVVKLITSYKLANFLLLSLTPFVSFTLTSYFTTFLNYILIIPRKIFIWQFSFKKCYLFETCYSDTPRRWLEIQRVCVIDTFSSCLLFIRRVVRFDLLVLNKGRHRVEVQGGGVKEERKKKRFCFV